MFARVDAAGILLCDIWPISPRILPSRASPRLCRSLMQRPLTVGLAAQAGD